MVSLGGAEVGTQVPIRGRHRRRLAGTAMPVLADQYIHTSIAGQIMWFKLEKWCDCAADTCYHACGAPIHIRSSCPAVRHNCARHRASLTSSPPRYHQAHGHIARRRHASRCGEEQARTHFGECAPAPATHHPAAQRQATALHRTRPDATGAANEPPPHLAPHRADRLTRDRAAVASPTLSPILAAEV